VSGDIQLTGPDLTHGVPLSDLSDGGMLRGHAHGQAVLLARRGNEVFAVAADCTHYGASIADGLMVGDTVRCPWHHACFDLRTGEAVKAPALRPLTRWNVEHSDGTVRVTTESSSAVARRVVGDRSRLPRRIVIVGAGGAGDAAADMLRRRGHTGSLTMIGADSAPPADRPNLSKDYLAGNAPEEWIPLRTEDFYEERDIDLVLGQPVTGIDRSARRVVLQDGSEHAYDALLLATGASPVRLPDSVTRGRVHYLRTLADSREIIAASAGAKRAVVIGASFIGLEVAASLRARGLGVDVVAPEEHPLERVLGREISDFIRKRHESKGVAFHLGRTVALCDEAGALLDDGERIAADLIVAGVGVRPNVSLAEEAGLEMDRGVAVNEQLQTSDPFIFAAGDIARYPDSRTGQRIRVEHWVVAQRQGQTAALNMLGVGTPFDDVPFFWSVHYDATINYVGHAEGWDEIRVDGSIEAMDCTVSYMSGGRTLAMASMGRDRASLEAELEMEMERKRATASSAR
jgi:NADPH-dependent 2,4-dienoyl-CoA reductase/sulfur reductase-like enzyme/nitrite reductase/ring-hydroxylating ferredoxin subunit